MVKVRYVVLIKGRVQHGGFRSFIKKHALMRGITGYAENLSAGEVLVVAEGEDKGIGELLKILEKEGPAYIKAEKVTKRREGYTGSFTDFERKGVDVLQGLEEKGAKEILLSIASTSKATDEKLERGVEILGDIKKDTSAILDKQGLMLEKQDKTIEAIKSVKEDTSAMLEKQDETISVIKEEGEKTRDALKEHLAKDIARLYEEIDEIKATLARVVEKVGA